MVLQIIFDRLGAHCFRKRKEPDSFTTLFAERQLKENSTTSISLILFVAEQLDHLVVVCNLQGPTSLFVVGSKPSRTNP